MQEQCKIFKKKLNKYYDRMPSPIKNHILLRKLSRDDRKTEGMILDLNR
jgi:hypothetical protein